MGISDQVVSFVLDGSTFALEVDIGREGLALGAEYKLRPRRLFCDVDSCDVLSQQWDYERNVAKEQLHARRGVLATGMHAASADTDRSPCNEH